MADRWHLLKSIGDEPERMMYRHMPLIRLVVRELSLKKSPEPEISVPVASLRRPERLKQQTRKNGISIGQRLWPCITRDVVSGNIPYYRPVASDSQSLGAFRNIP